MDDPMHAEEGDRSEKERLTEERQREEMQMAERTQREEKSDELRWTKRSQGMERDRNDETERA